MPVLPGAEPFHHDGSTDIGVLLCHGFTGSPQSMRPWAEHVAELGWSVRCPRLPGHGTTIKEMNTTRWPDWYSCVEYEFDQLRARCAKVFVFGLSMGATLTLRLAQQRGSEIAGIAVVNPSVTTLRKDAIALPLLAKFVESLPGVGNDIAKPGVTELAYSRIPLKAANSLSQLWRVVRADLGRITVPVLLMRSAVDHVVEPVNASIVTAGIRSADVTTEILADSYHVATLDHDAATIFWMAEQFVRRVATGVAA